MGRGRMGGASARHGGQEAEKVREYWLSVPVGTRCPGTGWPTGGTYCCVGCGRPIRTNRRDLVRYHVVKQGDRNVSAQLPQPTTDANA